MTLIHDEFDNIHVWVDTSNHDNELSPRFDDEESAIEWYGIVSAHVLNEFGITGDNQ